MNSRLKLFGKYGLFWLFFFIDARIFFLLYHHKLSFQLNFSEWILVFIHGMRMDVSVVGYILLLIGVVFLITAFFKGMYLKYIVSSVTYILLPFFTIIFIADLELYRNWGFRMDTTPLLYLKTPKEAMASVTIGTIVLLISLIVIYLLACTYVYRFWIEKDFKKIKVSNWKSSVVFLFVSVSMILPIRGSLGIAPLNTGMVYFSNKTFANHAAINVVWNVMYSLTKIKSVNQTYNYFELEKANSLVDDLKKNETRTKHVLRNDKPNVVIIILESFTSNVIGSLGGIDNVTPNLNKYTKEGLLFNNFFASGDRSDKGIVAVLSGYPAQPKSSIIKFPQKTQALPYLSKDFNRVGYETAFYYGGDINFANMRSYLMTSEYDEIISKDEFNTSDYNSKWGAHDHVVFDRLFDDIKTSKQSFLKVLFTLSSHEPFEVPMETVFEGTTEKQKFLNSIYYTDKCLGEFVENLRESSKWDNTLIVLVADHGNRLPQNVAYNSKEKFKIPMLWLGGALAIKDSIISAYGSQEDIPVTLLNQLDINASNYIFGKDLISEDPLSYAFYVFNDGVSYNTNNFSLIYDNVSNSFLNKKGEFTEKDLETCKAYMQLLGNDFVNK